MSVTINTVRIVANAGEPVWPSGKGLSWSVEGPRFDPLRLSFLSKIVVYGHCPVTLPTQLVKRLTV